MTRKECNERMQTLVGEEAHEKLLANGREMEPKKGTEAEPDFWPVVKLFLLIGEATWLLTEIDPEDERVAFGCADLGLGFPEMGSVWLPELLEITVGVPICKPDGTKIDEALFTVEKDPLFTAKAPLSWYAREARAAGSLAAVS